MIDVCIVMYRGSLVRLAMPKQLSSANEVCLVDR